MGRITEALKKVTDERVARVQKKPEFQYVVKRVENTNIDDHVVSFHDSTSPVGEQYKILRTNIQTLKFTKNYKTFLITSSLNAEGKSITSANLAIAMAHDLGSKSVLLIDADMRKGKMEKYLGLKETKGLSEVLKGEIEVENALVDPGIENLTVLLSGKTPRNPSELLNSKKMEKLIAGFKARFDYIFIDSPPVMPVTDACIIGPMTDGAIMVIQASRTQRNVVRHAENRLSQARTQTLGYVIAGIEYHVPRYLQRYIHEYGYYDAYYKEKEKEREFIEVKK